MFARKKPRPVSPRSWRPRRARERDLSDAASVGVGRHDRGRTALRSRDVGRGEVAREGCSATSFGAGASCTIELLRTGSDRLLDAYRNVKRTFLEATEALGDVEARAAAERSTTAAEPLDIAAEIAAEIEALDEAASADVEMTDRLVVDLVAEERDLPATTLTLARRDALPPTPTPAADNG